MYINYFKEQNITEEFFDIDDAYLKAISLLEQIQYVYLITDRFKYRLTLSNNKLLIAGVKNV